MYQVAGSVFERNGIPEDMVVGITTVNIHDWAQQAYKQAEKFVKAPTVRSKACRCVIMAIQRGLQLNRAAAFSFQIYVRTYVLANKVKGKVRNDTECIKKAHAVDDTGILLPFERYLQCKLFDAMDCMPPARQRSVTKYLEKCGRNIATM